MVGAERDTYQVESMKSRQFSVVSFQRKRIYLELMAQNQPQKE